MTDAPAEFPKDQWPTLSEKMAAGGTDAVIAHARTYDDPKDRLNLLNYAFGAFSNNEWKAKSLDAIVALAEATIADALMFAEQADDDETRVKRTDFANIVSYNLSANLAECWPGDDVAREPRHFERGLEAAEACIAWRTELKKPAGPFSMAWWAKGMHLLSLGRAADSLAAFEESQRYNVVGAIDQGEATEVGVDASFGLNLGAGYIGIAAHANGVDTGRATYDSAVAAFEAQVAADGDKKNDAQFGLDQLAVVATKYLG